MLLRLLSALSSCIVILAKTQADTVPSADEVQVFDGDNRSLVRIVDAAQLAVFYQLWSNQHRVPGPYKARSEFHYSIMLANKGIWLYSADGYVTRLDHLEHPRYRLNDVQQFNKIIGISP